MDKPTVDTIRAESKVGFAELGFGEPAVDTDPDPLELLLNESIAELVMLLAEVGVTLDIDTIDANSGMALLVNRAIRMLTEYNAVRAQQEQVETAGDFDMVQSFSVSSISETRRSMSANANILHPWPALNKLLGGIVSLIRTGTLTGLDPRVPVIQSVEPGAPKPGWDLMYATRWMESVGIYGDLRPLGVYRVGD